MELNSVLTYMKQPLLQAGKFSISVFSIIYILGLFTLLYFLSNRIYKFFLNRFSTGQYTPTIQPIATLLHYGILFIGTVVILQTAGVDMSSFTVLAGVVGIGLGFGLQSITNNFISGIVILFERPIKLGDRIEVKDVEGQVTHIGMRASTVLTNDNVTVIVPNSDFISSAVVNWSHTDEFIRLRVPISVSYKSDPHHVIKILEEVLENLSGLLKDRKSDVILDGFSDGGMKFYVRVWTKDFLRRPGYIRHRINLAIWDALKNNDIEIYFPQMDLRFRDGEFKLGDSRNVGSNPTDSKAKQ